MFEELVKQFDGVLSNKLAQHIKWRILITKDTMYVGKVLKIIAQNVIKTKEEFNDCLIDVRYTPEQAIVCIPLKTFDTKEEVEDYLNTQAELAAQVINKVLALNIV